MVAAHLIMVVIGYFGYQIGADFVCATLLCLKKRYINTLPRPSGLLKAYSKVSITANFAVCALPEMSSHQSYPVSGFRTASPQIVCQALLNAGITARTAQSNSVYLSDVGCKAQETQRYFHSIFNDKCLWMDETLQLFLSFYLGLHPSITPSLFSSTSRKSGLGYCSQHY